MTIGPKMMYPHSAGRGGGGLVTSRQGFRNQAAKDAWLETPLRRDLTGYRGIDGPCSDSTNERSPLCQSGVVIVMRCGDALNANVRFHRRMIGAKDLVNGKVCLRRIVSAKNSSRLQNCRLNSVPDWPNALITSFDHFEIAS
jgi:hypothetical protein